MDPKDEVDAALRELLEPHARAKGVALGPGTELVGDLGLDSLIVMEILLEVEDRFDVSIPLNILPNVSTLGDFAEQVRQLLHQPK